MNINEIIFISEQNGEVEREFKQKLNEYFLTVNLKIRTYLAKVVYGDQNTFNITLCIQLDTGYSSVLLDKCSEIFASMFAHHERLDIIFLDEQQELKLREICCPFYTSLDYQISTPDFYLISNEGYGLDKEARACFKRKRLYGKHPDGYLLCDISPSLVIGSLPMTQIIIASRHKGFSLFPIKEWPVYVHVAKILNNNIINSYFISEKDVELIAWTELLQKEA